MRAALRTPRGAAGFTLIEIVVAAVVLSVGVLALVGANRVAALSAARAAVELRAAQLIQDHTERLRTLPIDSVKSGATSSAAGSASWLVTDSTTYLSVRLAVTARPEGGSTLSDTVYLYRPK